MLLLGGIVALNGSPRDYFNKNNKNAMRFSSYKCKVKSILVSNYSEIFTKYFSTVILRLQVPN